MKLVITSIIITLAYLQSCATYTALPKGTRSQEYVEETIPSEENDENVQLICAKSKIGTKYYCQSDDELFYVHIDPYKAVTCQKIEFYGECGKSNSGSLWWDFGDETTSSLKMGYKTYQKAGNFSIKAVCTFVDGRQRSAVLKAEVSSQSRGSTYSSFPGYWYNWDVTEIKTGDTSCPRIELK